MRGFEIDSLLVPFGPQKWPILIDYMAQCLKFLSFHHADCQGQINYSQIYFAFREVNQKSSYNTLREIVGHFCHRYSTAAGLESLTILNKTSIAVNAYYLNQRFQYYKLHNDLIYHSKLLFDLIHWLSPSKSDFCVIFLFL